MKRVVTLSLDDETLEKIKDLQIIYIEPTSNKPMGQSELVRLAVSNLWLTVKEAKVTIPARKA